MTKQQALVQRVKRKNRLSNISLCGKIVLDLMPQVMLIHLLGVYFVGALSKEKVLWGSGAILLCFAGKTACGYLTNGLPEILSATVLPAAIFC